MSSKFLSRLILISVLFSLTACVRDTARIIVITATFPSNPTVVAGASQESVIVATSAPSVATLQLSPMPDEALSNPTPNATRPPLDIPAEHTVQAGETLSLIAARYSVTVDAIMEANNLDDPNLLSVGQVLKLPTVPDRYSPNFKIIPDSRLVRGPQSNLFNIESFINQQTGYIRSATDVVDIRIESGAAFPRMMDSAEIIERVSIDYSVDARLLLALLEFRAGYLSNPQPLEMLLERPLVSEETAPTTTGLYNQLSWAANQLNNGYYGWKSRGVGIINFDDGSSVLINPELNPGTIGVQHLLSLDGKAYNVWQAEVGLRGLYAIYVRYFGDPFAGAIEPLVPSNIQQPPLQLPFESGVEWRYTGGPHGGWGSGSAWSSVDFAPSEDRPQGLFCYVSDSWLTALAPAVVARAGEGAVVLDLDGDGNESTGWTIMFLHLASEDMVQEGIRVNAGDRIGHPSCAGGFSNATHTHIGRRFNGEWLPADCQICLPDYQVPPFVMGGWRVIGIEGEYYQGFMNNGRTEIQAEQGRETTINRITG
jgi:LasA protease